MATECQHRHWQLNLKVGEPGEARLSRRVAGTYRAHYEWLEDGEPYSGHKPVPTKLGDSLSFLVGADKFPQGVKLRVLFRAFSGPFAASPFGDLVTQDLKDGVEKEEPSIGFFKFGPYELTNLGHEYQFMLEVQAIGQEQVTTWCVDPEMDVDGDT